MMATSVIVTPIPYNAPVPGTGTLDVPLSSEATFDRNRRVIYQILRGNAVNAGRVWIARLDMDTCTETARVEIVFPSATIVVRFVSPVSIEGTDWIAGFFTDSAVAPYSFFAIVNVTNGAMIYAGTNTLGAGTNAGNYNMPRFVLDLSSTEWLVVCELQFDVFNVIPAQSQLTHTAFGLWTVNKTTGALSQIAWGNQGPAKSALYESPTFLNTFGETFVWVMFPGNDSGTGVEFFVRIFNWSNAGNAPNRIVNIYKISVAEAGTVTSTLVKTFTEADSVTTQGQGRWIAEDNSIIYNYTLEHIASIDNPAFPPVLPTEEYRKLVTLKIAVNSGAELERTVVANGKDTNGSPSNFRLGMQWPTVRNDSNNLGCLWLHNQKAGKTWSLGETWFEGDLGANVYQLDNATLTLTTKYSAALLATRYNQAPYNYIGDDYLQIFSDLFLDAVYPAIYAGGSNSVWTFGQWERWTFGAETGGASLCFYIKVAQFTEPALTGQQTITWS